MCGARWVDISWSGKCWCDLTNVSLLRRHYFWLSWIHSQHTLLMKKSCVMRQETFAKEAKALAIYFVCIVFNTCRRMFTIVRRYHKMFKEQCMLQCFGQLESLITLVLDNPYFISLQDCCFIVFAEKMTHHCHA